MKIFLQIQFFELQPVDKTIFFLKLSYAIRTSTRRSTVRLGSHKAAFSIHSSSQSIKDTTSSVDPSTASKLRNFMSLPSRVITFRISLIYSIRILHKF